MKKASIFFVLTIFLLFVAGCETKYYSVLITNKSSNIVSFVYNDINDTIAIQETKFYAVKAYTQPPSNIVDQNGIASIKMEKNSDGYFFTDEIALGLYVSNQLPIELVIKASNYIDYNGSPELTIGAKDEITAKIYTKTPVFTTIPNYPVNFDWSIIDDTIYLTIR